jgi:dethiobiotin synthetase
MKPIFITGIGTGVGKTLVAAVVATALGGDYWKPVQAGYEQGTDSEWIKSVVQNRFSNIYPEVYKFKLAASPHMAAAKEGVEISIGTIIRQFREIRDKHANLNRPLVIEGAGGLLVPLNERDFVIDLVEKLDAKVLLVSRNYLGSINHSLLTALACKSRHLDVAGWIFNDRYLDYEEEIVRWSNFPKIGTLPFSEKPNGDFVRYQAEILSPLLQEAITKNI